MNLRPGPQNNFGLESGKELIKQKHWNPREWLFYLFSCNLTPQALKTPGLLLDILGCAFYINSSLSKKAPSQDSEARITFFFVSPQGFSMVANTCRKRLSGSVGKNKWQCSLYNDFFLQKRDTVLKAEAGPTPHHWTAVPFLFPLLPCLYGSQIKSCTAVHRTLLCRWSIMYMDSSRVWDRFWIPSWHKKWEYKIFCSVQKKCFNLFCSSLAS